MLSYRVSVSIAPCSIDYARWRQRLYVYIYIIYTPNLGLEIAVFDQEREQGRFRGSIEGATGEQEGARGSSEGARREQEGALWGSAGAQQVGA